VMTRQSLYGVGRFSLVRQDRSDILIPLLKTPRVITEEGTAVVKNLLSSTV
jgi:hypothetical protein